MKWRDMVSKALRIDGLLQKGGRWRPAAFVAGSFLPFPSLFPRACGQVAALAVALAELRPAQLSRELTDHSAAIEWRIRAAANSASSCRRRPDRIFPASLFLRPSARVTQPSSRSFMY